MFEKYNAVKVGNPGGGSTLFIKIKYYKFKFNFYII